MVRPRRRADGRGALVLGGGRRSRTDRWSPGCARRRSRRGCAASSRPPDRARHGCCRSSSGAPRPAPPEPLPESEQRRRLFDALARALLAPGLPLLLVADDLQWCDVQTLQLLHYLVRTEAGARLLVAATARREEIDAEPPRQRPGRGTPGARALTEIESGGSAARRRPCSPSDWLAQPLVAAEVQRLYDDSEGNPLFVVEALRAGWTGEHAALGVTPRVQAVIDVPPRASCRRRPASWSASLRRSDASSPRTCWRTRARSTRRRSSAASTSCGGVGSSASRAPNDYDFSHDKIREVAYLRSEPAPSGAITTCASRRPSSARTRPTSTP